VLKLTEGWTDACRATSASFEVSLGSKKGGGASLDLRRLEKSLEDGTKSEADFGAELDDESS